jgi:hypothetical protein
MGTYEGVDKTKDKTDMNTEQEGKEREKAEVKQRNTEGGK